MIEGKLRIKESSDAEVDSTRQDIVLNHSATHLLHEALRHVLGEHVVQKGSLWRLIGCRFDFSHSKPLTPEQIQAVEDRLIKPFAPMWLPMLKKAIWKKLNKKGRWLCLEKNMAIKCAVSAWGNFLMKFVAELMLAVLARLEFLKLSAQMPSAAGVRRIEAMTGAKALGWITRKRSATPRNRQHFKSRKNIKLSKD